MFNFKNSTDAAELSPLNLTIGENTNSLLHERQIEYKADRRSVSSQPSSESSASTVVCGFYNIIAYRGVYIDKDMIYYIIEI